MRNRTYVLFQIPPTSTLNLDLLQAVFPEYIESLNTHSEQVREMTSIFTNFIIGWRKFVKFVERAILVSIIRPQEKRRVWYIFSGGIARGYRKSEWACVCTSTLIFGFFSVKFQGSENLNHTPWKTTRPSQGRDHACFLHEFSRIYANLKNNS